MNKAITFGAIIAMLLTISSQTNAQHRRHHRVAHSHVAVVAYPAVSIRVNNRLDQQDRFAMASAYLANNDLLSIKTYAKMTGLNKRTAEAELDSFANDKQRGIACIIVGRKKMYKKI